MKQTCKGHMPCKKTSTDQVQVQVLVQGQSRKYIVVHSPNFGGHCLCPVYRPASWVSSELCPAPAAAAAADAAVMRRRRLLSKKKTLSDKR